MTRCPKDSQLNDKAASVPDSLKPGVYQTKILVNGVEIEWNTRKGQCNFRGIPVALLWIDSTLAGLMSGMAAMVGPKRFNLALQAEGRKSVESDWLLISSHQNFPEGFKALNINAAVAGWGDWQIVNYAPEQQRCVFRAYHNWEGMYQKALGVSWGSGMLAGKFSGICSKLFQTQCWATQTSFVANGDAYDEFEVLPSTRSIENEIEQLLDSDEATRADMAVALQKLKQSEAALRQEIAERIQAEHSLKSQAKKNRMLLRNASDGIHILDQDGNVIEASDSFCQMLGYRRDEIIGMNVRQWDAKFTDAAQIRSVLDDQFANPARSQFETRHRRKDGSIFDVEVSGFALTLNDAPALFNSSRDITERLKIENALKEREQRLREIIDTEPECVKVVDSTGQLIEMNAAGLAMLEADSLQQAQQHNLLDFVAEEDKAAFAALHRQVMDGHSGLLEFKITGLQGTPRYLETHATPMRDGNGDVTSLLGITRDITQSKQAEQQLRIAATAFETQEGMMVTDADCNILQVNQAFTTITGYCAAEVIGKNPRYLSSGRHDKNFFTTMWESINRTGSWGGEIWNRRKNGEIYPEHLTITAVRDANGRLINYVAALTDITISKASAEKIEQLAFFDPLTDLPNRRLLLDRARQALASSARSHQHGALLFLDLDHFKNLNDTLGHDIGDLLLHQVAERLTACVREGDTVARFGGDEFVLILEDLSKQEIESAAQTEAICQKILFALRQPYQLDKHAYHTSSSIGVTLFCGHVFEVEELLKQADIAMYQAKKAGRNTLCFFNSEMQKSIVSRAAMEADLRQALDKRQFELHYQIQVHSSGRIMGAEALIRWRHPQRGMVPPNQFIVLAEETGLIFAIGLWVLETACAQLAAWQYRALTRDISISVNVSANQFHQADFAAQVQNVILKYAIDPGLLKLELTETLLLHNIADTIKTMTSLKQLGVQFSLDDFGTGYSSLRYLQELPLDQIKIDQSFIRNITSAANDAVIVRTIIAMAQSLGLNCIAEGVETEEQKQLLLDNGCTDYQGYLFGRPMPVAEFELLLTQLPAGL